ncbi:MAG: hypothetical protein HOP96_00380 [Sphingomonas sp.]|nr:hypothetical protein [Sphingomonas sp.]
MNNIRSRGEAAEQLRDQAASCRRLALMARTVSGSEALRTVARQFDWDAARIDPVPTIVTDRMTPQAASLIRVREALERQTAQWLQRRPQAGRPEADA